MMNGHRSISQIRDSACRVYGIIGISTSPLKRTETSSEVYELASGQGFSKYLCSNLCCSKITSNHILVADFLLTLYGAYFKFVILSLDRSY
jgi:hypothetical protein